MYMYVQKKMWIIFIIIVFEDFQHYSALGKTRSKKEYSSLKIAGEKIVL